MSNPFTRLIAQAETNLGEMSRRAIESATAPLKAKSQEVIAEVVATATRAAKTLAIKAGLAIFGLVMFIVALVFGLIALCRYLERVTGPIEALVIMAAIFAVLAIAAIVAIMVWPSGKVAKPSALPQAVTRARHAAESTFDTAARGDERDFMSGPDGRGPGDREQDLKTGFDAVVSALGDAGFRREQAGLRAGLIIANQLRPVQLVSLALLGGFFAGIRMTGRRR